MQHWRPSVKVKELLESLRWYDQEAQVIVMRTWNSPGQYQAIKQVELDVENDVVIVTE